MAKYDGLTMDVSITDVGAFKALLQLIVSIDEENPELNIVQRLEESLRSHGYELQGEEVKTMEDNSNEN